MKTIGLFHGLSAGIGGGDRVLIALARGLVKNGYGVKVFTVTPPEHSIEQHSTSIYTPHSSAEIFGERLPAEIEIVTLLKTIRRIKFFGIYQHLLSDSLIGQAETKTDLLIQTGGGYQPVLKSKKRRIAYVQALWNKPEEEIKGKYRKGLWRVYYKPYHMIMTKRIKALENPSHLELIANSNYTKSHLVKTWKINPDKVHVVYPPLDLAKWFSNNNTRHGVVHVSRFSPEKNHELMLEIINGLPVTLTIIGNTTNFTNEMYLNRLRHKAPINTTFLQNISHREIKARLAASKVFLSTSHETFGLAVIEAIDSGCIPVVPDHSGNRETVPFEELRYHTVEEARSIIHNAIHGKYDEILPHLQDHIKQFSEEIFVERMLSIIKEMI